MAAGGANPEAASAQAQVAAERRAELLRRLQEVSRQTDEQHLAEPGRTVHDKRVWLVLQMMLDGAWVTGRSAKLLAEQTGLSVSYWHHLSTEASTLYKTFYLSSPEELELLALRVRQGFERLAATAEQMAAAYGPYAIKVAGEQLANMALYAGLKPAAKHEHTGKDGAPLQQAGVVLLPAKAELTDADDGD